MQEQIQSPQPSWEPSLPFLSLLPRLCCSNTSLISLPFTSRCLKLLGEPWLMQEEQQWGVNEHRKLNVFMLFVLLWVWDTSLTGPHLLQGWRQLGRAW